MCLIFFSFSLNSLCGGIWNVFVALLATYHQHVWRVDGDGALLPEKIGIRLARNKICVSKCSINLYLRLNIL